MNMLYIIAILILALVGLRDALLWLCSLVLRPWDEKGEITLVRLSEHMEDAEFRLRGALHRSSGRVVALDCGADEETLEIAHRLAASSGRLTVETKFEDKD